jgi:hypothetical protein
MHERNERLFLLAILVVTVVGVLVMAWVLCHIPTVAETFTQLGVMRWLTR